MLDHPGLNAPVTLARRSQPAGNLPVAGVNPAEYLASRIRPIVTRGKPSGRSATASSTAIAWSAAALQAALEQPGPCLLQSDLRFAAGPPPVAPPLSAQPQEPAEELSHAPPHAHPHEPTPTERAYANASFACFAAD